VSGNKAQRKTSKEEQNPEEPHHPEKVSCPMETMYLKIQIQTGKLSKIVPTAVPTAARKALRRSPGHQK